MNETHALSLPSKLFCPRTTAHRHPPPTPLNGRHGRAAVEQARSYLQHAIGLLAHARPVPGAFVRRAVTHIQNLPFLWPVSACTCDQCGELAVKESVTIACHSPDARVFHHVANRPVS
jgi:hypothetical protein